MACVMTSRCEDQHLVAKADRVALEGMRPQPETSNVETDLRSLQALAVTAARYLPDII